MTKIRFSGLFHSSEVVESSNGLKVFSVKNSLLVSSPLLYSPSLSSSSESTSSQLMLLLKLLTN